MSKYRVGDYIRYIFNDKVRWSVEQIISINDDEMVTQMIMMSDGSESDYTNLYHYESKASWIEPYPEYLIHKQIKEFLDSDSDVDGGYDV